MKALKRRIEELEEQIERFQEDLDYIYDRFGRQDDKIDEIRSELINRKAEIAEYIRSMTDTKFKAYQKLVDAKGSDITQTEIADELDIDDAVLSRFKKEFKKENIL